MALSFCLIGAFLYVNHPDFMRYSLYYDDDDWTIALAGRGNAYFSAEYYSFSINCQGKANEDGACSLMAVVPLVVYFENKAVHIHDINQGLLAELGVTKIQHADDAWIVRSKCNNIVVYFSENGVRAFGIDEGVQHRDAILDDIRISWRDQDPIAFPISQDRATDHWGEPDRRRVYRSFGP